MRRLAPLILLAVAATAHPATGFDRLRAVVDLDDAARGRGGSIVVQVLLDNNVVFESPRLTDASKPQSIDLPLGDASDLRLVVADGGDGPGADWADWADARLVDTTTGAVVFLSDLQSVVDAEWVATRRDRNVDGGVLTLGGTRYPRGLGALSRSSLLFPQVREAASAFVAAARKNPHPATRLSGRIPADVTVLLDGKPLTGQVDAPLAPVSLLTVRLTAPKGTPLLQHPVFEALQVSGEGRTTPLRRVAPTRILHDAAPGVPSVTLDGRPYYGGVSAGVAATIEFAHLAAPPGPPAGDHFLYFNAEVRVARRGTESFGTAEGVVLLDGVEIFRSGMLTPGEAMIVDVGLPTANPRLFELRADDCGDGSVGDLLDWAGARFADGDARGAFLSDLRPALTESEWGGIEFGVSADRRQFRTSLDFGDVIEKRDFETFIDKGVGMPAPASVLYRDLRSAFGARFEVRKALPDATRLLADGKRDEALTLLRALIAKDTLLPEPYPMLAQALESGAGASDPTEALRAWRRVIDVTRAPLAQRRTAREHIERLYAQLRPTTLQHFPEEQPPLLPTDALSKTTDQVYRVTLGDTPPWAGQAVTAAVRLRPSAAEKGKTLTAFIATRGLAVSGALYRGALPATGPASDALLQSWEPRINPALIWQVPDAGDYTLVLTHEPGLDGFDSPLTVYWSAALRDGAPAPTEKWTYELRNDGSAAVTYEATGPGALLLPHTADAIEITALKSVRASAAAEYGSLLPFPYTMGDTLVFVPAVQGAQVKFIWRDAAFNVPMSYYQSAQRDHMHFASLPGINDRVATAAVTVTLPPTAESIASADPAPSSSTDFTHQFTVAGDRSVTLDVVNPSMDTRWLVADHAALRAYLPDTFHHRRWLPEYQQLLGRIHDREQALMGRPAPQEWRYIYVTGPTQMSGFGGATWWPGQTDIAETWIAATGRIGEYNARHQPGGAGVEAHEMKWVFLQSVPLDLPRWLLSGTLSFLEEQGRLAADTGFGDYWTWRELQPCALEYQARFGGQAGGPVTRSLSELAHLPPLMLRLVEGMDWFIVQSLFEQYGPDFWPKFWRAMGDSPHQLRTLTPPDKDRRVLEVMTEVSGDANLRAKFEAWGFRFDPDPRYAPERFVRLPGLWRFHLGDDPDYAKSDCDVRTWDLVPVPSAWEELARYAQYDGFAWYRLTFPWPETMKGSEVSLLLGKIADADEVYFNGVRIGGAGGFPPAYASAWMYDRAYPIPKALIRPGQNTIAVRVYNDNGPGGLYAGVPALMLTTPR